MSVYCLHANNEGRTMTQFYTDVTCEIETNAPPNAEVFYVSEKDMQYAGKASCWYDENDEQYLVVGWYYWSCFPGCLPDSDPIGPFDSEQLAVDDARDGCS